MARWSEARRTRQAARVRLWQPWQKSTGPKSAAGKQRAAQNAMTHGMYCAEVNDIRADLRAWGRELRELQKEDW